MIQYAKCKQRRHLTHRTALSVTLATVLSAATLPAAFAQTGNGPLRSLPVTPNLNSYAPQLDVHTLERMQEQIAKMPPAPFGNRSAKTTSGNASFNRINIGNVQDTKWESVGPNGIAVNQSGFMGQDGSFAAGRVFGVALDPRNPSIFYAATAGGGLWRFNPADTFPTNPTYPWRPLGDQFPTTKTNAVAVSPFNSKVIFVATQGPLMRSINGGNSFISVGGRGTVTSGFVRLDPAAPDNLDSSTLPEFSNIKAITFDPDDPNTVYVAGHTNHLRYVYKRASTPTNPVTAADRKVVDCPAYTTGLFVSHDLGFSWQEITPAKTESQLDPTDGDPEERRRRRWLGEEWNSIRVSAPDDQGARSLYASNRGDGIYKLNGSGWQRINAPLQFNAITNYVDPVAGGYGITVTPSALDPNVVYVMDSNQNFNDGRIFKTTDGGATWIEISGNYPINQGTNNNWSRSAYAFAGLAVPAVIVQNDFVTQLDYLVGSTRNSFTDLNGGRDWLATGLTHIDQHDLNYTNTNPNQVLVANDGGVYSMQIDATTAAASFPLAGSQINKNLVATEFLGAAFHPTAPNIMLGGTNANGAVRTLNGGAGWQQIPGLAGDATKFSATALFGELPDNLSFAPGIPFEGYQPAGTVGSSAIDSKNPAVQYFATSPGNQIFVTTDSWAHAWEITPSRTIRNSAGQQFLVGGNPINVFTAVNGGAADIATAWASDQHKPEGVLFMDPFGSSLGGGQNPFGSSILYTGGKSLYRYDLTPGFAKLINAKNIDRGQWRRVGTTVLADEAGDFITAIAVGGNGNRVYVGTHLGKLWVCTNARNQDATTPVPQLVGTWFSLNTTVTAGNALNGALPSRQEPRAGSNDLPVRCPINAISVNPLPQGDPNGSSDILVAVGADINHPGTAPLGLYRCANTISAPFLFTPQNGLPGATARLPQGININCIARDTITINPNGSKGDVDNSFFVGSDNGIFFTNDQGTTWYDATVPLGLPAARVTALDTNRNTGFVNVSTEGRGVWRLNLSAAAETVTPPVLSMKYALSRSGTLSASNIAGSFTFENSGGQALNVKVLEVKVTTTAGNYFAVDQQGKLIDEKNNPINLNTIGTGPSSARTFVAIWKEGRVLRRGDAATITVKYTYTGAPAGLTPLVSRTRIP